MSRLLKIEIKCCKDCPCLLESNCDEGRFYCNHPDDKQGKSCFIHYDMKNFEGDFPDWCPLKEKSE